MRERFRNEGAVRKFTAWPRRFGNELFRNYGGGSEMRGPFRNLGPGAGSLETNGPDKEGRFPTPLNFPNGAPLGR
eukprot:10609819-Alexandrium_andersonii.AAC.1